MANQESKQVELKLKGVMDFYVSTYFEYYGAKIKELASKENMFVETDIMEAQIDDNIKGITNEASQKFHDVCMLILDSIVSGRIHEVREFEVLFVDLLKRTLVSYMQSDKNRPTSVVIIADPEVDQGIGAKEN